MIGGMVASVLPTVCTKAGGVCEVYSESPREGLCRTLCCTDGMCEMSVHFGRCLCCLLPVFVNRQPPCPHTNYVGPPPGGGGRKPLSPRS